jgi:hypothetical protein
MPLPYFYGEVDAPRADTVPSGTKRYAGLLWPVSVINPGPSPAWIGDMDLCISPVSPIEWTSIAKLCVFLDKRHQEIEWPLVVDRYSNVHIDAMIVSACGQRPISGGQDKHVLKLELLQQRNLGSKDLSGWQKIESEALRLPENFGIEETYTTFIPDEGSDRSRQGYHQP